MSGRAAVAKRPAEAELVPVWEGGDPFTHTDVMRVRLRDSVRALLEQPGLVGAPDPVRMAAVVLAAKARSSELTTHLKARELGRWLGVNSSIVSRVVRPHLVGEAVARTRDAVVPGTKVVVGIDWLLLPLWEARHHHPRTHPLRLAKPEFAVLLRLLEAVCAPGWSHADGTRTLPGLLGRRTGQGAATDRLALLLLVLEARSTGVVRLCGGAVDRYGRAVATLARLLSCTTVAAATVLSRLETAGVVEVRQMAGGREQLLVPAVVEAYREMRRVQRAEGRPGGLVPRQRRGRNSAGRDQDPEIPVKPQVSLGGSASDAGGDCAGLHAYHSPVATGVDEGAGSGCFSGQGRTGTGVMPVRACTREDQAAAEDATAVGSTKQMPEDGPLRGEMPMEPPADEFEGRGAGVAAGARPKAVVGEKTQQQRGVALPRDLRLRVALAPVSGLWAQLSGGQQQLVGRAAGKELALLGGLAGPESAPRLLADRLKARLKEVGGEALVRDTAGWLLGRALVQRRACSDQRCDDGIQVDTGGDCPTCGNVIHIRRAQRARLAAEVDAELPGVGETERREVLEDRLRRQAAREAEDLMCRRQQAEAEQARRAAARAEAGAQAERERAAAEAAEAARRAQPCADCGAQRSGGLCEACGYQRRTEDLVTQTALVAASWAADLTDRADIAAVTTHVRADLEDEMAMACQRFMELMDPDELHVDAAATASAVAFARLQAAEQAAAEYRSSALAKLARSPESETEAKHASATEKGRRLHRRNPDGPIATAAAEKAAHVARERTAQHLLATRLEQLRGMEGGHTDEAAPERWPDRLHKLVPRAVGNTAREVIA
ncbi:hypothetical protein [Streptomyces sp. NPDC048644]|uniref:hypothetical protein n=1 Tax=Streptomyces sp. NPDC048644 TaxID=3365582 RepID=UPI0037160C14